MKLISSGTTDKLALFGEIGGNATIRNVVLSKMNIFKGGVNVAALVAVMNDNAIIDSCKVDAGEIKGVKNVGGLIGLLKGGSISNCANDNCTVTNDVSNNNNGYNIGGVIGNINASQLITIHNIESKANVSGHNNIGGVIGLCSLSNINEAQKMSNISMELMNIIGYKSVGGVIGFCTGPINLENVKNRSSIDVLNNGDSDFGGIIGTYTNSTTIVSTFTNCISGFNEMGTNPDPAKKYIVGKNNVGGIIGFVNSSVEVNLNKCRVVSNISGENNIGGIIGLSSSGARIVLNECKNQGANISSKSNHSGGLCGHATNEISFINCSNEGNVFSEKEHSGGFIGRADALCNIKEGKSSGNVTASQAYAGGYIGSAFKGAVIEDIKEVNVLRTVHSIKYSGGAVGYISSSDNNTKITNIAIGGHVNKSDISNGASYAGGIAGYANGITISNSKFAGSIISGIYIGGITGWSNSCNIDNCIVESENDIISIGDGYIGGIAGYAQGACVINNCINREKISGGDFTGGIVGRNSDGIKIYHCHNQGSIQISSTGGKNREFVGGVIGQFTGGEIKYCSNRGEINVPGYKLVGGLIGEILSNKGEVVGCYNIANIAAGKYVGGLIGKITGFHKYHWIQDCYNKGTVSGENSAGVIGREDMEIYASIHGVYNIGKAQYGILGGA